MSLFARLAGEFPRDAVSWRCQTLSKAGDKGLALAYIDARDVMRRLDEVVGPENWQDRYEAHGPRIICYLSLRICAEWITKADGAGDTDVEAEKGALSDAFKRAAVKWGIGRYLYDVPAPWAPCESYERPGGKRAWSRWTADPWSYVRQPAAVPASPPRITSGVGRTALGYAALEDMLTSAETAEAVRNISLERAADIEALSQEDRDKLRRAASFKLKAMREFTS